MVSAVSRLVGVVLLGAAAAKIVDGTGALGDLVAYVPMTVGRVVFASVVAAEVFVGVLLVAGHPRSIALGWALTAVFSCWLTLRGFTSGWQGACSCFGEWFRLSIEAALIRNLCLLAVLSLAAYGRRCGRGRVAGVRKVP